MATPVFCCGFECGVLNSQAPHWGPIGTCSIDTTTVRTGARSLRVNPTAAIARVQGVFHSGTEVVWRYYLNVASAPNATAVCGVFTTNSILTRWMGLGYNTADSKWYPCEDDGTTCTLGSTGVSLSAGWHRIDCKVNVAANPWTIDVQVDGNALPQLTRALAATTLSSIYAGNYGRSITFDIYIDDVIVSSTGADYPLGAGYVKSYVPNADGTHTATTTTIVKGTIAAPTGGGNVAGATDVFNWVNARPINGGATDNTRLVNQQTAGATLYAEVDFEPSVESAAPRTVEVATADRQASTAAGSFEAKLNDNGTEDTIISRIASAGVTSDRYARKHYATMVGGGAWTLTRFNALKARFGYSGDATPDQYWRGIMIEAEYVEVAVASDPLDEEMNQGGFAALIESY